MHTYLLAIHLPEAHASLANRLVKSAELFLESRGPVGTRQVGRFSRRAGKGGTEVLHLLELSVEGAADEALGRSLEGVLRSTLGAAGVPHGDARVYAPVPGDNRGTP